MEIITVNGWYAGRKGVGLRVQSMGEMGKVLCPKFLRPLFENIDRRSCNDGSRELIPIFHNPHRKCRPSPSAVARILEYLEVPKVGSPYIYNFITVFPELPV